MGLKIGELFRKTLLAGVWKVPSETETAVHAAPGRGYEKGSPKVFMEKVRARAVCRLEERVAKESADGDRFIAKGDELAKDRVIDIPSFNLLGKAPRKAHRKGWIKEQERLIGLSDVAKLHDPLDRGKILTPNLLPGQKEPTPLERTGRPFAVRPQ